MSRLFADILTIAFAMFFAATSAGADSCIASIIYPTQNQMLKGEVPVMISIGSNGQASADESVDLADIQIEYMSDGRWVLQDDLSAQSMLEPIEGSDRKAVIYSIANIAFKGRYGQWRMRAKCAGTAAGDYSPWSSWRQFQVIESAVRKKK